MQKACSNCLQTCAAEYHELFAATNHARFFAEVGKYIIFSAQKSKERDAIYRFVKSAEIK
jgi:hypothetical protein